MLVTFVILVIRSHLEIFCIHEQETHIRNAYHTHIYRLLKIANETGSVEFDSIVIFTS